MNGVSFKKREILRGGQGAGVGFSMKDSKVGFQDSSV